MMIKIMIMMIFGFAIVVKSSDFLREKNICLLPEQAVVFNLFVKNWESFLQKQRKKMK